MANQKTKIFIIEDEPSLARALEKKLNDNDFDVKVAYNGEDAINVLNNEVFDFYLIDLLMPKKDGFEVLAFIKERKLKGKSIVISNLSQDEDRERVKELGAEVFFVKAETPIVEIIDYIKANLS